MQKVLLTIDNTKDAYLFLKLIKQFGFVRSIEFEKDEIDEMNENEIFIDDWENDFYLDDLQMSVKEFRLQTLKDEKESGMSKQEFFDSLRQWRTTVEQ